MTGSEINSGYGPISEAGTIRPQTRGERLQPSLEVVPNAFVAAQTTIIKEARLPEWRGSIYDGGVYHPDGTIVEEARHNASSNENVPAQVVLNATNKMSGNFLYGGVLRNHFGHFLVESIGRLWGSERTSLKLKGIVFNPYQTSFLRTEHPNVKFKEKSFITEFLKLLNIDLPLIFPSGVWQFENLVVPGQLIMNTMYEGLGGHPILRDYISRQLTRSLGPAPASPKRSVYVSRGRLAPNQSVFLQEAEVEANFKRNGYEIIHPETMNLRNQLGIYQDSCRLVFAEGSAGHLIALTANPMQKIGIIRRQRASKIGNITEHKFERQIRAFGCSETYTFSCISKTLNGRALGQPDIFPRAVIGILDFEQLRSELAAQNFIDPNIWSTPSANESNIAIREVIAEFDRLATPIKNLVERRRKKASTGP